MENTQEQKTPEMWFQKLKEPYRSEAIANIVNKEAKIDSIDDAILKGFEWDKTKQRYEYWEQIHKSLSIGETTYLEPETLTPEQMELSNYKHLDWVVIETKFCKWLIKVDYITDKDIHDLLSYNITKCMLYNNNIPLGINEIKLIRPATKEEVLKYFPDEVFENVSLINEVNNSQVPEQQKEKWSEKIDEIIDTHVVQKLKPEPIELRPEDLVSGEVYTLVSPSGHKYTFTHNGFNVANSKVYYDLMYSHKSKKLFSKDKGQYFYMDIDIDEDKFYHATPEEKALLLGEEETELEKVKKLLEESNRLYALKTIEFTKLQEKYDELQELSDAIKEDWDKKVEEIEHLKSKQQLEPKGEKVYFYMDDNIGIKCSDLQTALDYSKNNHPIYEAICIGKKKSVLVSE